MLTDEGLPAHLRSLLSLGEEDSLRADRERWRDYVAEFNLGPDDVPALLRALDLWFQWHGEDDYPEPPEFFAPIHAWRALGQLQAIDAVAPMLAHADLLDEKADEWSTEDWRHVFALIGPSAIDQLAAHLRDPAHTEYARDIAASGLKEIATRHPEYRGAVVQILSDQLAKCEPWPTLNGLLLWKLLDLDAKDSAEVIERAFAAEVVDEELCGSWTEVREKLGVEGLGIAPLRPRQRSPLSFGFRDRSLRNFIVDQELDTKRRQQAKREKAKRKQAQQSRKRNRKSK